jgi:glycosyltransferase involved in cell wall biosynthesis
MLRVVYLGHTARLSGAELALTRLLPHLERVAAHVILAEDGPLADRLRTCGASVEILPLAEAARAVPRSRVHPARLGVAAPAATSAYVLRLVRRFRTLRPHLVHANTLKSWIYGAPAARLAGVPVVWHLHDRIARDYLPAAAIGLVRSYARRFPAVIVANSSHALATVGNARVPRAVIGYPTPERPAATPDRQRPFTAGMVGRIAEWKGQDVFLQGFADAFPQGCERGAIVGAPLFGEHVYERKIRMLAEALGLEERVEFRGFQEDVDSELDSFDVLVHASVLPEPFGQVVAEGMAAGLPVVAAGAGGPAEIIEDGVTGLLYPPRDVNALADCLRRIAADPALRSRLGAAGRARVRDFRPELVAEQMMTVYDEVLGGIRRAA